MVYPFFTPKYWLRKIVYNEIKNLSLHFFNQSYYSLVSNKLTTSCLCIIVNYNAIYNKILFDFHLKMEVSFGKKYYYPLS